jgi:hypothetical protein
MKLLKRALRLDSNDPIMNKLVPWILIGLVIVLFSTTLFEYDQVLSLEHQSVSTTTFSVVSNQTVTLSSASVVTSTILVEVTTIVNSTQSRTTTVTITGYQPTSAQTCTAQPNSLGPCNFHQDGILGIAGLGSFYYLDITSLGSPTSFTFEGVTFSGFVNYNACAPHAVCTGPSITCVDYSALVIKTNTPYKWSECNEADQVALYATIYLYPQNSPHVGFMWLPDGTIYMLVAKP